MAIKYITLSNGVPHAKDEFSAYETTTVVGSTITAGTSVTLPAAATYNSSELELYLNNVRLENVDDYTYVGVVPRTQVQFTFDLVTGDVIRFRKDLV